jgi:hypothetical protein
VAHDRLARNVKLADLADNLANNYRLNPSPDVTARIDRYQRASSACKPSPAKSPEAIREEFLYELKADPAGGLRPPFGPATTRRSPGTGLTPAQ